MPCLTPTSIVRRRSQLARNKKIQKQAQAPQPIGNQNQEKRRKRKKNLNLSPPRRIMMNREKR
jgi:hypothetical protein